MAERRSVKKIKGKTIWSDVPQLPSSGQAVKGSQKPGIQATVPQQPERKSVSSKVFSLGFLSKFPLSKAKKEMKKTYEDPQMREKKRWDKWESFSAISGMSVQELVEKADRDELDFDRRAFSRIQKRFYSMPKITKRQHYACGDQYLVPEQIPCLNETYAEMGVTVKRFAGSHVINSKVALWFGDITRLEVDAIVNSSSSNILEFLIEETESGVSTAIAKAASSLLTYELQSLQSLVSVGEVLVTSGYLLPAKYIFHTSGPAPHNTYGNESLTMCYKNCLQKLVDMGLRTLAFSCVSTGLKGYPREAAAECALQTVRDWLTEHSDFVDKIIFCIFDQYNWKVYQDKVKTFFPPCASTNAFIESILPVEILRMDKRSIELYKKALEEGKEAVHSIRVMVVGHYGVGKTTLTKRLFDEDVDIDLRESTNGIQVHVRRCKVDLDTGKWRVVNTEKTKETAFNRLANLLRKIHPEDQKVSRKQNLEIAEDHFSQGYDVPDGIISLDDNTKLDERKVAVENTDTSGLETKTEKNVFQCNKDDANEDNKSKSVFAYNKKDANEDKSEFDETLYTHLKELVEEIKELSVDDADKSTADLSVWDFAGQYAFYATHQVFLSRRAVYLLVTDISKHTDDVVQDDDCFLDSKGAVQCKITDYVNFWLNSIHEFCSSEDTRGPPVILVGTFVDKLKKETRQGAIDEFFYKLRCSLVDRETSRHLANEDFAVDNTEYSSTFQSLREKIVQISAEQDYWGELIPARWITLENILLNLKAEGLKVIEKSRVTELNLTLPVPMENSEELELFLTFHHESGNVIYFGKDDCLNNTVVLDPQWLVDAFKCLITAKMFCCRQPDILKQWIEFDRSAVLRLDLIDAIWKREDNFRHHIELLLQYLEKLGLLARPCQPFSGNEEKVADYYFAPSVLKEKAPPEIFNCSGDFLVSTSKLCFTTTSHFMPTAVFNKLIALCLEKFPLAEQQGKQMIYCGCGMFSLRDSHRLCLFFCDNVIQVWLTRYSSLNHNPDELLCLEIRDLIKDFLTKHLHMISMYVRCPKEDIYMNNRMFALDELVQQKEVLCSCQNAPHVWKTEQLTKYWCEMSALTKDSTLTDQDLNRIAYHIGKEYNSLGIELGLTQAEMDHINIEHRTVVERVTATLIKWRDTKTNRGTFQELRNSLLAVGSDVTAAFSAIFGKESDKHH